jgi:hypothetical protein
MPIGSMSRAGHTVTEPFTQDPLSAMAPLLRVRPELQDLCRFALQWDTVHEAEPPGWAQFHIVTKGRCLLERHCQPGVKQVAEEQESAGNATARSSFNAG